MSVWMFYIKGSVALSGLWSQIQPQTSDYSATKQRHSEWEAVSNGEDKVYRYSGPRSTRGRGEEN